MKEQVQKLRRLRERVFAGAIIAIAVLVAALFLLKRAPVASYALFVAACAWQLLGMRWLKKSYRSAYMRLYALEGVRNVMKDAQYAAKAGDLADLPVRLGLVQPQELLPHGVHYHVLHGRVRSMDAVMEECAFAYRLPGGGKNARASFAGTVLRMPGWKSAGMVATVGNPFPSLPATQRLKEQGFEAAQLPAGRELPEKTTLLLPEGFVADEALLNALERFANACEGPACLLCTGEGLTLMLANRFFTAAPNLRQEVDAKRFAPLNLEDLQQGLRLAEAFKKM